jgi:hypothetical protein
VTAEASGSAGTRTAVAEVDDIYDVTGRGAFAVARALLGGTDRPGLRNAGAFVGPDAAPSLGIRVRG